MQRIVLILAAAGIVTACSGASTGPSGLDVSGTWSGPITDARAGSGTAVVTLSQSGTGLSGSWSSTYSNSTYNNGGQASGTISGDSVSMKLAPSNSTRCPYILNVVVSGTTMTGTFVAYACSGQDSGTVSVTKS